VDGVRSRADVVFPAARLAVFVDGCFWHGCPEHRTLPRANGSWWMQKLEANSRRDLETTARLEACGWTVVRVWEHENPEVAADEIAKTYRRLSSRQEVGREVGDTA
jgi:DNA mismatch endonuclease (patch repair protein)